MPDPISTADRHAVVCNVQRADGVARAGAKVWVTHVADIGGGGDRPVVLVRSRSGRLVERRMAAIHLRDFRVSTVPAAHPRYADERIVHDDRYQAQQVADMLAAAAARTSS